MNAGVQNAMEVGHGFDPEAREAPFEVIGNNPKHVNTSHAERQNRTMRTRMQNW
jgi:hypothetical protein